MNYRKRAEGGFVNRPEFALIGEAGREAIIPLEKQARGAELWIKAGRELGMLHDDLLVAGYQTFGFDDKILNKAILETFDFMQSH